MSKIEVTKRNVNLLKPKNTKFNLKYFLKYKYLYILCIPGLIYLILFKYVPMYGVMIAFKDFSFKKGILGSQWNDFANFKELFFNPSFYLILKNSVMLSILRLLITFPFPIILALALNEIRSKWFKRTSQTIMYLPHFISWVVICGITINFLSMQDGIVNIILSSLGFEKINFLGSEEWFRTLIIGTNIWKEAGWGTIIYLAALTSINPEYYEAAIVDGANRFHRIWYITLAGIKSTIVILLILNLGSIMGNGFEQIFLFQNSMNSTVSEVFETYTYKMGIIGGRYSFSTAVGLFQSLVGCILVFLTNKIARMLGQASFY